MATLMNAKYPGRCTCGCSGPIVIGQQIEWSRATGARMLGHAAGQAVAQQAATAPRATHRPGRRTGCVCGSREGRHGEMIYSPRNCASCNHDA